MKKKGIIAIIVLTLGILVGVTYAYAKTAEKKEEPATGFLSNLKELKEISDIIDLINERFVGEKEI